MHPPDDRPSVTSYRTIIRNTGLIAGTQLIIAALSALRLKVTALILGPAGVGAVGLFQSFTQLATTAASLGHDAAGVKLIAGAPETERAVARIRYRLYLLGLSTLLVIAALLFSDQMSALLGARHFSRSTVLILVLSAVCTMIASGLIVEMRAGQAVGGVARAQLWAALLATLLGVGSVFWIPAAAPVVIAFLPGAALLAAAWFEMRRYRLPIDTAQLRAALRSDPLRRSFRMLAALGIPLAAASLANHASMFSIRALIEAKFGLAQLGIYVGSFIVAEQYLGFLLAAMATDYLPRLVSVSGDHDRMNEEMSRQSEVIQLTGFPVVVLMITFSDIMMRIFYSAEFGGYTLFIQLMLVSGSLKLMNWPFGFAIISLGKSKAFLIFECMAALMTLVISFLTIDHGLTAIAVAYVLGRIAYFIVTAIWLRREIGFAFSRQSTNYMLLYAAIVVVLILATSLHHYLGYLTGIFGALVMVMVSWSRIRHIRRGGRGAPAGLTETGLVD